MKSVIAFDLDFLCPMMHVIYNNGLDDTELFHRFASTMFSDNEYKKFTILLSVLQSGVKPNPKNFVHSFGSIIGLVICLLQFYFSKLDATYNERLVEWMEQQNESEYLYMKAAEVIKKLHKIIDAFNQKTANNQTVVNTVMGTRYVSDGEEVLYVHCYLEEPKAEEQQNEV